MSNLIFVLTRRWPILLVLPLLTLAGVVAVTPNTKPAPTNYTAKVYLAADPDVAGAVSLEQAAIDIKQADVAKVAAASIGEPKADPKQFAVALKVKAIATSLTLQLTAEDPSRTRVQRYAMAFANAYIKIDTQKRQNEQAKQLVLRQLDLQKAEDALTQFQVANAVALGAVNPAPDVVTRQQLLQNRVDQAQGKLLQLSDDVASPFRIAGSDPVVRVAQPKLQLPSSRPVRASLALILGIIGALAVVAFIEKLNPRIDTPADAEQIVGAPVLAMVPVLRGKKKKAIDRADLTSFSGPFAESFRAMRSHLDYRTVAEGLDRPPSVMIVSSVPTEGKTTTTAFLALSYAEAGRDVITVGADFRRPAIHRLFDVPRMPGLTSRLLSEEGETLDELVGEIVKHDELTGVRVVPSGPGTDRVTGLLNDLSAVTDAGRKAGCAVVVDTAPIMVANDAIDFLPSVDWVIVVVRLGRSTVRSLRQTMQNLELNHAKVVGCAVLGSLESSDSKRYYYSYYKPDEDRTLNPNIQIQAARRQMDRMHEAHPLPGEHLPSHEGDEPGVPAEVASTNGSPTHEAETEADIAPH